MQSMGLYAEAGLGSTPSTVLTTKHCVAEVMCLTAGWSS